MHAGCLFFTFKLRFYPLQIKYIFLITWYNISTYTLNRPKKILKKINFTWVARTLYDQIYLHNLHVYN